MGFFVDLGMQTDFTSAYARSARDGIPNTDALAEDAQTQPLALSQHDFVIAFRDWIDSCIKMLEDMVYRKRAPKVQENGAVVTGQFHSRLEEWDRLSDYQRADTQTIDNLLSWQKSLERAKDAS